ncbi:MAG: hypothetical protein NVS3B25_24550 [Hymenobacter sp.]
MENTPLYRAHPSLEGSGKDSHVLTEQAEQRLRQAFRSDEQNYVETLCQRTLLDGDYRTVPCEIADGHLWVHGVAVVDLATKVSCSTCRRKVRSLLL